MTIHLPRTLNVKPKATEEKKGLGVPKGPLQIKSDDVISAALCDAYRHDVEHTLALPRKSESGVLPVCVCLSRA